MSTFFAIIHSPVVSLKCNDVTGNYDIEIINSSQICIGVKGQHDYPLKSWWRGSIFIIFGQPLKMSSKEYENLIMNFEPKIKPNFHGNTFMDAYENSFRPYLKSLVEYLKENLGITNIELGDDTEAKLHMKRMDEFYKTKVCLE